MGTTAHAPATVRAIAAGASDAHPQRMIRAACLAILIGCATPATTGPVASSLAAAADEAGVPADLLLAIAAEEGGLELAALRVPSEDDQVPVAGALELRHGRLDTLALGARLMGTTEAALRSDTVLANRAGARVVAALGATADPATWRPMLEALSGMDDANARDYATRVIALLRTGGEHAARAGEIVRIAAHAELPEPRPVELVAPAVTPDFPGAIWFTTSCTNKCTPGRPLGHGAVDKIVIHDTEGGWSASVATLQNDAGKSVHYIVDKDGSRVGQFRAETDTTWHAGNYFYNETSVGIEHVGVAASATGYSAALYAKSRALVASIRTRWTVPLDRTHIVGHYQVPNGSVVAESSPPCTSTLDACETSASFGGADTHRDPGYHWQWCQYMAALGGSCTCNDTYPLWNCTTDRTQAVRCSGGHVEIEACPAGCDVMPVGTEDVCHTAAPTPPDAGVPAGDGDGGSNGGSANPDQPAAHGGGCATSGSQPSGAVMLGMLGLLGRRRCRRAR